MKTDNFVFYMPNRLIQTSQTGGQPYSDTSPFSIPWLRVDFVPVVINKCCLSRVINYCGKMVHWKGPSCEWFITFFLRHRRYKKIGGNDIFQAIRTFVSSAINLLWKYPTCLLPWTNFSLQDKPWAEFSTLEVAACIQSCTYCPV